LERSDHVGIPAPAILFRQFGVVDLVAGSQDNCANLDLLDARRLIVIDGASLALI
jgi:hypothetical protein